MALRIQLETVSVCSSCGRVPILPVPDISILVLLIVGLNIVIVSSKRCIVVTHDTLQCRQEISVHEPIVVILAITFVSVSLSSDP